MSGRSVNLKRGQSFQRESAQASEIEVKKFSSSKLGKIGQDLRRWLL